MQSIGGAVSLVGGGLLASWRVVACRLAIDNHLVIAAERLPGSGIRAHDPAGRIAAKIQLELREPGAPQLIDGFTVFQTNDIRHGAPRSADSLADLVAHLAEALVQ